MMIEKDKRYFEVGVERLIQYNFKDSENYHVVSHIKQFRKDTVHEVMAMEKGKLPEVADIYYMGEYVCEVNEHMNPEQVLSRIHFALYFNPKFAMLGQRGQHEDGFIDISSL